MLILSKLGIITVAILVSAAIGYLLKLLFSHNFAFEYVAEYTSRDLSGIYVLGALWAGNQGAMLFWACLVAMFSIPLAIFSPARNKEIMPFALVMIMSSEAFILSSMIFGESPFALMAATPLEGLGLTPFFKHIGMLLHPPLIMVGYAGLLVTFALAIGALVSNKLDNNWLISARRWALFSWLLLGAGIILGAWWNYTTLGDGQFWHWDPIENASFLPWLTATAFLHSIVMQRKQGILKAWSLALIILTFILVIFSTYLNHGDIIADDTSSFMLNTGQSSKMSVFILAFLTGVITVSVILMIIRWRNLTSRRQIDSLLSKESSFLLTNLLLVAASVTIFAGTIYMLVKADTLLLSQTLVAPFFNRVGIPFLLAIILLGGICVRIGWRRMTPTALVRALLIPLSASLLLVIALFLAGVRQWYIIFGFALCSLLLFTTIAEWVRAIKARHAGRKENYARAFFRLLWSDRPRYGGYMVHLAIAAIAIGLIGTSYFKQTTQVILNPGDYTQVGVYSLHYQGLSYAPAYGRMIFTAPLIVEKNDEVVRTLEPVKYFDQSFSGEVNTAAVLVNLKEDLYVTIVGWDIEGRTEFRIGTYPMVIMIWSGGWFMILGGLIAFWPDKKMGKMDAVDSTHVL